MTMPSRKMGTSIKTRETVRRIDTADLFSVMFKTNFSEVYYEEAFEINRLRRCDAARWIYHLPIGHCYLAHNKPFCQSVNSAVFALLKLCRRNNPNSEDRQLIL